MRGILKYPLCALFLFVLGWCFALGTAAQNVKLTGTPIGSTGYNYSTGQAADMKASAFDGNLQTYYASYDRSKTWVGLDLGKPHVITRVGWSPRNDGLGPGRMVLALFEGSNREDFMDAVPLHLIDQQGTIGKMDYADVNVSLGFRYVRYVGPNNARCNVAELEFYGHAGEGDSTQFYQLTNLPTVSIHTKNNIDPTDKVTERVSTVNIIYDGGTRLQQHGATTRCRGNASFSFEKKPYRIKFDEKVRVLKGSVDAAPAKAKKWTLINNWGDKTLMRNIVAFEVSRRMGLAYTPFCKPVDVILNGEYRGCYQLSDQITVHKDRVNVTEMEPTDNEGDALTGGYLIEVDGYADREVSWFTSSRGIPVTIKSPDENDITTQQHNYIYSTFNELEKRLFAANFTNEQIGYRSMLDVESFMKYFLQEQLVANPDIFWSTYMYKERSEAQFHVGPCWDFDNAFNNDYRSYDMNDKTDFNTGGAANMGNFVNRILSDPYVTRSLRQMWKDYREQAGINLQSVLAYVDSTAALLDRSQRLNFMRWDILNQKVHMNPQAAGSYEGEVEFVRTFLRGRFAWMDRMLGYGNTDDGFGKKYEIETAAELAEFARAVSSGQAWADAVLKADIDYTAYDQMIGSGGVTYRGTFDGAGHTVKIKMQRNAENAGLFNYVGGTVKDLTVTGTIQTSAKYAGGVVAQLNGGVLQRCRSLVAITSTVNGDGTHGGLVGITNDNATIQDCVFAGSIVGSGTNCCGGFVGWANGSTTISSSLMIGDIQVDTYGSNILARNEGNVTAENCYYCTSWHAANNRGESTSTTPDKVRSGEVCYQLNHGISDGTQVWYQTLGEDEYPLPDATHGTVKYDGRLYYNDGERYVLIDGTAYEETQSKLVKEFVYTRNFSAKLQPVCLPLEAPASSFTSLGLTPYAINGVRTIDSDGDGVAERSYIEIEPVLTGVLPAYMPFIVCANEAGYRDLTVTDVALLPAENRTTTFRGERLDVDFVGTYSRIFSSALRAKGAYVLGDSSLQPATSAILHLCRWYALVHPTDGAEAPATLPVVVKGEEDALGILELRGEGATDGLIYDLSGRPQSQPVRGVHVQQGHKVLGK